MGNSSSHGTLFPKSPAWLLEVIHGLVKLAQVLSGRPVESLFIGVSIEVKCLEG